MKIDIDKLTEAELIDLNNRVVARLKILSQIHAHSEMLEFKIGDRVTFQPEGRQMLTGMITRYNRKTVTVITDAGQQWRVSPGFLRLAELRDVSEPKSAQVISLHHSLRGQGRI